MYLPCFYFSMSCLHIWFSKLKWSMDTLLRFYERHAYVCALHKETKLLFDELIFCLQRLYSVPLRIDLPFANPDFTLEDLPTPMRTRRFEDEVMKNSCPTCHTSCSNCNSSGQAPQTPSSGGAGNRHGPLFVHSSHGVDCRPLFDRTGGKMDWAKHPC